MEMETLMHRFEPLWGQWMVEEQLGAGSFGTVWKVRCAADGRCAAVKLVVVPFEKGDLRTAYAEGLTEEGAKYYFQALMEETQKEVDLMQDLAHCQEVVHFEDHQVIPLDREGEFGWAILIRMELLVPFRTRLLKTRLDVRDVGRLGMDLSQALEACRAHGIVHRDIKPENLFYAPETGGYKLGDFGVAHYLQRPTEGKGRAGTLTHMPPEVYQGEPFGTGADLYALGMILYRLLNDNRIPFLPPFPKPFTPVERDRALVRRLRGAAIPPPSIVGDAARSEIRNTGLGIQFDEGCRAAAMGLGRIAQKAIAAKPEERFASPSELRNAIADVFAMQSIS